MLDVMLDVILYGILPYVAFTLAIAGGLYRYFRDRFSYSSLSSEFLEKQQLFWGSVPWHYGIVLLLIGHLIGWAVPKAVEAFNGVPLRLYILEITALGLGLSASSSCGGFRCRASGWSPRRWTSSCWVCCCCRW
jgi:nitrate reductase gamma subunit